MERQSLKVSQLLSQVINESVNVHSRNEHGVVLRAVSATSTVINSRHLLNSIRVPVSVDSLQQIPVAEYIVSSGVSVEGRLKLRWYTSNTPRP
jgi:hypothetical protein